MVVAPITALQKSKMKHVRTGRYAADDSATARCCGSLRNALLPAAGHARWRRPGGRRDIGSAGQRAFPSGSPTAGVEDTVPTGIMPADAVANLASGGAVPVNYITNPTEKMLDLTCTVMDLSGILPHVCA